ncbi:MAG: hypothetical protein B6242_09650 [Anaerolineaceae bacterium 4572_78]|nr:MAG: hypothetical protein B6242_09650 [Anaerolineaceae bacterium 4572_78]
MLELAFFFLIWFLLNWNWQKWHWQYLLKPMGNITFWPTFRAFMIGVGGNMVLPARAGEFLRAYVIGRSSNISKVGSFATVVVERIFDGLTMLFILLLIVIFGANNQILKQIGIAAGIFYVVAFVGVIVFMLRQSWFEDMLRQLMTILNVPENVTEKILDLMSSFGSGLESLRDGKQLAMVIILSFLTWGLIPLSFWPVIAAFDFGVPVPFLIPLLAMPVIALGLTIPGAPAGIGIFQWAGVVALNIGYEMLGTPLVTEAQQATVAASMILLHISQVTPEVLLGIVSFFAEGLTMSDLEAGKEF